MFDQAIASAGSKSGSLGIAMNIYRQLERAQPDAQGKAIQDMQASTDKEQVGAYSELQGASHVRY